MPEVPSQEPRMLKQSEIEALYLDKQRSTVIGAAFYEALEVFLPKGEQS